MKKMDDTYRINVAKTRFREAYNGGDVDQLLSVFDQEVLTDMSEGEPTRDDKAAMEALREHAIHLFAEYSIKLTVIIINISVLGNTAYDYGWHEFTLTPKNGGEAVRKRQRYLEVWKKNSSGDWKIALFINNADVREEIEGQASHWFRSEEASGNRGRRGES
jgi:ketosteroid isomerase-like protein